MKKAVIFDVSRTLSAYSLLFFQMPVSAGFYSAPGQRGVPRAYVDALLRELSRFAPGRAPAAGHPLFRRWNAQSCWTRQTPPGSSPPRSPCPGPRSRWKATLRPLTERLSPGIPGGGRQPHFLRRPVGPGQPAQDAGPPPHGKAGAGRFRRRTPCRVREHQLATSKRRPCPIIRRPSSTRRWSLSRMAARPTFPPTS